MLAGELQRYNQRVQSGEVPQQPSPSQQQPPPLGGAHVPAALSQSLPSGGGHLHGMRVPPQPRMRPRAPPTMAGPPILELPEQSPHSSSLLDSHPLRPGGLEEEEEEDEFVGGTCVSRGARTPPPRPYFLLATLTPTRYACLTRRSMLEATSDRHGHSPFLCAASAPATMLWGPGGHRCVRLRRLSLPRPPYMIWGTAASTLTVATPL